MAEFQIKDTNEEENNNFVSGDGTGQFQSNHGIGISLHSTKERKWKTRERKMIHKEKEFPPSVINTSTQRAPHDLFELFFDDEVIKLLVQYSNQYHYEKSQEKSISL